MATANILYIKHEQFLKIIEERVQNEGMDLNIQRIMHDYLVQKRKIPWTINLEKIFLLYVRVCIAVDETDTIKDALTQYKFLTQITYSSSLENVLTHIRTCLEGLFNKKIQAFKIDDVKQCGDIESEEIDHDLLTSYLNIEEKKKEIEIKKTLRQIFETYKYIIETSKLHKRLEEVYTTTVETVLKFCQKYNRTREFKRFLDSQHQFLDQLQKREVDFAKNPNHINIFQSETRDYLIKVRLDCADFALQMGYYGHAFVQLEDISILINLRKVVAQVKPSMMSTYYLFLSKIFWSSKYYCYHTYFLYHHYLIHKNSASVTEAEKKKLTNEILLGVLSIPTSSLEGTQNEESRMKIAQLQRGSNKLIPKKEEIVQMILRMNLNEAASEQINTLFNVTLNEINIFNISKKVEPIFKFLRESTEYSQYVKPIEENLINRVLSSISKVYKSLNIENLYRFLSFSNPATCDYCLINSSSSNQINCRIDQSKRVIMFNLTKAKNDYVNASSNITNLAQAAKLISSSILLEQTTNDTAKQAELVSQAQKYLESSKEVLKVRNDKIISYLIKKEKSQNQDNVKREYEDKLFEEKERVRKMEEYNRKMEEKRLREAMEVQLLKQKMEIRTELIKIKGPQIAKIEGIKIENMTEEDLRPIDIETLQELKKNIIETLKEQQENKYKKAFTKIDYIERETRKVEQPKVKALMDKEIDLNLHVNNAKQQFESDLKTKQTLEAARNFKESFFKTILEQRKSEYETKIKEFKIQIEKEFKNNILKSAEEAYYEDLQKKEEEERKLKEEKQKQLLEQINNQQAESTESAAGWRIVQELDQAPPTFDDIQTEKSRDDQWRNVEISRGEKKETTSGISRGQPGSTTLAQGGVPSFTSDKITRNTVPLAAKTEESDNAWRTTQVKATTKPIEATSNAPFRSGFTNTKRPDGPSSSNTASSGNPNDGGMRRGFGGPSSSTTGNKPSFGKPSNNTGNPNATDKPMSRNNNSNTNNKPPGSSSSNNNSNWRK